MFVKLIDRVYLCAYSASTIGYRHSIVKTQVTQSNSKSEMIDMVKLILIPGLLSSSKLLYPPVWGVKI
jgi:hypothetical protein